MASTSSSSSPSSDEAELLTRLAANHLFLGQFEPFRAVLISLRRCGCDDRVAAILRAIIAAGGRVDGVLFSGSYSCPSPSHLAWLSALELVKLDPSLTDPETLLLKAEFLLLLQLAITTASESMQCHQQSADLDDEDGISVDFDNNTIQILHKFLDVGVDRLKSEMREIDGASDPVVISDEEYRKMWKIFLDDAELFDALCQNIQRQLHGQGASGLELAVSAGNEERLLPDRSEVLEMVQRNVQMAHLYVLRECVDANDFYGAISHLRFLHLGYKVEESEYKSVLADLVAKYWPNNIPYGETWLVRQHYMLVVYVSVLQSGCVKLVQMLQHIQDEALSKEIEDCTSVNQTSFPIKKFLESLPASCSHSDPLFKEVARYCMMDLYHYARLSGAHVLELIVENSLSFIKEEKLQEANMVASLFPRLRPLIAVLSWDMLSGQIIQRRKLMKLLWASDSKVPLVETYSLSANQTEEVSFVEYLCDLLCFHLDVARFIACVNSSQHFELQGMLFFSQKGEISNDTDSALLDAFVENLMLERLAFQSPMRVLFDVVPEMKFEDAIKFVSSQPVIPKTAIWKRVQDIELIHMRYSLDHAIFALGAMENSVGDEKEQKFFIALSHLRRMQNHLESIKSSPRKVFMVNIVSSLLHMNEMHVKSTAKSDLLSCPDSSESFDYNFSSGERNKMVVSFVQTLLDILRKNLPQIGFDLEHIPNSITTASGRQALEWRLSNAVNFIEDWDWRLSILQRLTPLSELEWSWKEALVLLRAAPSKLLNLCMQREKYDIGGEAIRRFSLPPEDKAALELTEWVARAFQRALAEDAVSHVADSVPYTLQDIDISSFRAQLGPLATILLCIDVAAVSARSRGMCRLLLDQAMSMLSEIFPGSSPRIGSIYWDQIQEVATISVAKNILQRLNNLLEPENFPHLQMVFAGGMTAKPSNEPNRSGQRQRAVVILHQMIDDAFKEKRQFLSGKLHNLARALADDEDSTSAHYKESLDHASRKGSFSSDKGIVLGVGLRLPKSAAKSAAKLEKPESSVETKSTGNRLLGPVTSKPSTYLSSFIIYIATIGDIVDGVDTTHDFNYFSLVYEWPKDLLIRLVFERGSTDAAEKVANIMGVDFVHEVISACVPPVLPPRYGHGWACMPLLPTICMAEPESKVSNTRSHLHDASLPPLSKYLYPLQLDIVKHLAKRSPVRAVLACIFGSSMLFSDVELSQPSLRDSVMQASETERSFYEFALEQSERSPTLTRWIQLQTNLHRICESTIAAKSKGKVSVQESREKTSLKRGRDVESDTELDIDDVATYWHANAPSVESPRLGEGMPNSSVFLSFDWDNEGPYENAVERLMNEGELENALALSDRCLRNGASDRLLQLLIVQEEGNNMVHSLGYGSHNSPSNTWQYCLRLRDKKLAAQLALKYLHRWELDAAINVLTMCICHLPTDDKIRNEVFLRRQDLQRYGHILSADDHFNNWQEVEAYFKDDPEGLALRLAGRGAVSAAVEVAESASLSIDLRRELQGRQLVQLLTTDPLSGGGPAAASRFLSSLHGSEDAMPVAIGAMKLLPDLRSKQLLVHFFLKRSVGNLTDADATRLNTWALGLRVLALLPLPSQQRFSVLHEHPHLIVEVLLMMKQLQSASLILKEFPSLRDDKLIISYAKKAVSINVNSPPREPRISATGLRPKHIRSSISSRSNIVQSFSNFQKEARKAFSRGPRDHGAKAATRDSRWRRKNSSLTPSDITLSDNVSAVEVEHVSSLDGQERLPFVTASEEWVLTGDPNKDEAVRISHCYETSPDITLFMALLSLCSDELVAARGAAELCITQMKIVLGSQNLPLNASMEIIARAYHATETYVQALTHTKNLLRKIAGGSDLSTNSERTRDGDDASSDTQSSSNASHYQDELSDLLGLADLWLGRSELLQSLLGSGILASLDDIADKDSSTRLRDRLIRDERYSMAVYTCRKCKIDAFPAWDAWGRALIRMEHYAQARVKFKQAFQLYKGDTTSVVLEIVNTIEGGPPVDVSAVRSMYEHLAKSAAAIFDDSLSAVAYLNVLYMPSTFPRSERSRQSRSSTEKNVMSYSTESEDGPRSNLDSVRYGECLHYFQEYARPQMLTFMFRHGYYADACALFLNFSEESEGEAQSSVQRIDPLATDYGSIDDLCDLCIAYGAMAVLEKATSEILQSSQSLTVSQYVNASLARICNYCETHRHFNYLYKFLVVKGDRVAAGLCCIQLFLNSLSQEEALRHLGHAKMHFEDALLLREKVVEPTKLVSKMVRGKSASEKMTRETIMSFSSRVSYQMDVVKALNSTDGPQWKTSLFGNPSDSETLRRRCTVIEQLAEKHFDLAFRMIHEFDLPAVNIYAGVAASLAERKRGGQLTEFLKNIKGTIEEDAWDQVLSAAINVYASKHKERPDRLIDMLISNHRKVLACVVCGRLKTAFQIASRSGSIADVQYVAHQAMHANALPVLDMCKQWLAQYM